MEKAVQDKLVSEKINKVNIAKMDSDLEKTFLFGGRQVASLPRKR